MPSRSMPILCPLFACLVLAAADTSLAASSNCTALSPLPSVLEVGEGLQQELQSPVAITRLAVGDRRSPTCAPPAPAASCSPGWHPARPA